MFVTYILNSLQEQYVGVKSFILFLIFWRDSALLVFQQRYPRVLSLDLKPFHCHMHMIWYFHLCMELLCLKLDEWSLNLKTSVIISGPSLFFTFNKYFTFFAYYYKFLLYFHMNKCLPCAFACTVIIFLNIFLFYSS